MSALNWLRNASGLFTPYYSVAKWRFLANFGCSCDVFSPEFCNDCYDGDLPLSFWLDGPSMTNGSCESCVDFNDTWRVFTFGNPCVWIEQAFILPVCGEGTDYLFPRMLLVQGQCFLEVRMLISDGNNPQTIYWRLPVSAPIVEFDHILPFYSQSGENYCDPTGSVIHWYE